jgi:hypothetical protein
MVTEIDEGKGFVKTYWDAIRKRVAKVEPRFAKLVDQLCPDKTFPIYLVYLPYGAFKGDTESSFIPKPDGGYYRLTNPDVPKEVVKHLGYGRASSPFGMVLEKELEYFIDLKREGITIPWFIYSAGTFFPLTRMLNLKDSPVYTPNGVLTVTSGARSAFMLPNIGCATQHSNLQRDFNVKSPPPKTLYEHWNIFKQIVNSDVANCDWRSCLIYFSQKWVDKIHQDKSWIELKLYLHELAWKFYEYLRNHLTYDIIFSMIQRKRNLKPNPYLADTAQHLLATALGAAPGYTPAFTENALPLGFLQKVFVESYGLKKYFPTLMHTAHFNFKKDKFPIYYSLKNPSTHVFSPKSRAVSSILSEIRELEHIMRIYIEELQKENGMCLGTIISEMASKVEFKYFHNETDRHRIVQSSAEIAAYDARFNKLGSEHVINGAKFASDASFLRGCISISVSS